MLPTPLAVSSATRYQLRGETSVKRYFESAPRASTGLPAAVQGPVLEGAGLNVTMLSYRDSVDFGFLAASDLVPDVWDLADAVPFAFAELHEAATAAG